MTDELDDLARKREEAHSGDDSQRILNPDHDNIGVFGENLFAARYGVEIDRTISRAGDPGWDFKIGAYTFDVKTSTHIPRNISPTYLKLEKAKPIRATIYVLALYDKATESGYLMGWEWGELIPPHSSEMHFCENGPLNYAIAHDNLRPMGNLDKLIEAERMRLENHGVQLSSK